MWRKALADRRGATVVLVALMMVTLGGFGALSIDGGQLYWSRQRLKTATEGAALAAAASLPEDVVRSRAKAAQYLTLNCAQAQDSIVSIDGNKVTVKAQLRVDLGLARLIGVDEATVGASSSAISGPVGAAGGVVPFGVEHLPFAFGDQYVLKLSADGTAGNFRALALGGSGGSTYAHNLKYGYSGLLRVGDVVDTEPGNMTGPTNKGLKDRMTADPCATYETVERSSPRFLLVPMVQTEELKGRTQVTVTGFAAFLLEGYGNHNGEFGIVGRFLRTVVDGEIMESAYDYGVRATKLVD